jgi:hypothetical protein
MKTPNFPKLLKDVRRVVLQEAAKGSRGIWLSHIVMKVTPFNDRRHHYFSDSQTTSRAPKKLRGLVQRALSLLAVQGMMFTRQRPEANVQSYEHWETDKGFSIRISQEEAIRQLSKM